MRMRNAARNTARFNATEPAIATIFSAVPMPPAEELKPLRMAEQMTNAPRTTSMITARNRDLRKFG